ncbi:TOMM precursor leader peptide-binding protein [Kitasatospora sp. SUK 42]|uniref:TOMM precursor leader peptide-binding protein n=1 Tax=Kitasatospora sp. SUK 42 TaxID=1588882 RepID=UPI0018CA1C81|nr:TOMM precursor leader peptide-binding protein [Kitasatospora sp. SUK 42]MBV2153697.1 TOMM precursor leader peptide-binding protein [Kitasatospora sp. SUK 42]
MIDLHVLPVGAFGLAVADRLASGRPTVVSPETDLLQPGRWPRARLRVVAAWRDTPALFDLVDHLAFVTGTPWLSVTMGANALRVGPTVLGGQGPCYRCFLARQYQHRQLRETDRHLLRAYDSDPALGPGGFLDAHVVLAGAVTGQVADTVLHGDDRAERGRVRSFGLLSATVSTLSVVPVHGCDRCHRPEPDATWRRLADDLRDLTGPVEAAPEPATRRG